MVKAESKLKKAIIGGGNLFNLPVLKNKKPKSAATPYGRVFYYLLDDLILIIRHGYRKNIPPHMINYHANIFYLKKIGVKFIFAFNSVGSLKKEITPGSFFIATDYIDFNPPTFYDKNLRHITPKISEIIKEKFEKILKKQELNYKKGIYFQTKGPRLETKAEVNIIKKFADVVGMTLASEATLAQEIGLEYASLCSIDNYAHGLFGQSLREGEIGRRQKRGIKYIEKIISEIKKS